MPANKSSVNKIAIVGLGKIGIPLALFLLAKGFQVVGTKTTEDGVEAARMIGIDCHLLDLDASQLENPKVLDALMQQTAILIIILPAHRDEGYAYKYRDNVQRLVDSAKSYHIQRGIFISSTSVYGEASGIFTESSPVNPTTSIAKVLAELETWLHALPNFDVDILRPAGLVGVERQFGRKLLGEKKLREGNKVMNLVHQADVVRAIELLIERGSGGKTYNLCTPYHPTRSEYYQGIAKQFNLPTPQFTPPQNSSKEQRVIDGSAICLELGFIYYHVDLKSISGA